MCAHLLLRLVMEARREGVVFVLWKAELTDDGKYLLHH
jgi:hypothetical protein